jgi:hypothetical protein
MTSEIKADKWSPASGTAGTIGDSGDTFTVPTGVGLTVTDEVKTNKISPATGTAFALGDSGDTFTVPSGATIVNSGTATGFGEANNPSFTARMSAHQSLGDNVNTKVAFDTTDFATSGTYDTTNYKWTPGVAGNYQFMVQVVGDSQGSSELYAVQLRLYKNGSALSSQSDGVIFNFVSNYVRQAPVNLNVCDTADDDDYYEVYVAVNDTSSTPQAFKYGSYFSAFLIIGSA